MVKKKKFKKNVHDMEITKYDFWHLPLPWYFNNLQETMAILTSNDDSVSEHLDRELGQRKYKNNNNYFLMEIFIYELLQQNFSSYQSVFYIYLLK